MASLFTYLKQIQRFTRDAKQDLLDPGDLIEYVNQARREVAMRAECVRVMPFISGSIIGATIVNGGTGYTNPKLVISTPDQASGMLPFPNGDQATGEVTQTGGVITNVNIEYGGLGYFQPLITVSDPTGTGAVIQPNLSPLSTLNSGQEVYNFSGMNLDGFPGVGPIYTVRSVAIIYTNFRYVVPIYAFTQYQALIRQYTVNSYQYVPCFGAVFGRGTAGSFYLYPPPTQTYEMEWDCSCLTQDLIDDQSVEAIPEPWTDAVPYYAAHLAFLELQNFNSARGYLDLFDQRMSQFGRYVDRGRTINPYGRP
jgi:hypothetical protein